MALPKSLSLIMPLRVFAARPRLMLAIAAGVAVAIFLPRDWQSQMATRLVIGWNATALLYLVLALFMMFRSTHERMRKRALQEDEGRYLVLALVVLAAFISLGATVAEMSAAKDIEGTERYFHVGLAALTIWSSWAFTQVMFALHYAHDYFLDNIRGQTPGLEFPGEELPDYGDFLYFSCIIGTSAQTADINISSRDMRRTGLLHAVLAFFFNTTVLALTVNIASGLF